MSTVFQTISMPGALHIDSQRLVLQFAEAMAEKLKAAQDKYGYSNGWTQPDWMDACRADLMLHIAKGDPRDVAIYAAFLWHHKQPTIVKHPDLEPHECWSSNNEEFRHSSLGDVLDDLSGECELEAGMVVYVATAEPPTFSSLVDADRVIEDIGERAYDYADEYADGYPEVTPTEKLELQHLIEAWLSRVANPRFWIVEDSKPYTLTEQDIADYKGKAA
ncbi:MAG: hypothetical protein K2X64_05515 [Rhodocyclaceae bacterium]|nr:hypothetical protein [Rhodocyclaceae bacterium]